MEELLKEGADPNTRFGSKETVLIRAARSTDVPLIRLLLRYGADPNIKDGTGKSPLDILLDRSKKNVETIALILEAGVKVENDLVNTFLKSKLLTKRKVKSHPYVRRIAEYLLERVPEGTKNVIKESTGL